MDRKPKLYVAVLRGTGICVLTACILGFFVMLVARDEQTSDQLWVGVAVWLISFVVGLIEAKRYLKGE